MNIIENTVYKNELKKYIKKIKGLEKLSNKRVMITGATGMIGSCIVDMVMMQNEIASLNCTIIAIGRNNEKAKNRFKKYWNNNLFEFISCDINKEITYHEHVDYLIHAASNTHPLAYATDPISTITTNVVGTNNLLDFADKYNIAKVIFLSSVEIYGQNKGDINKFSENYLGYINCNTQRAGYPESKRTGEALCQAYISQKKLNISIVRLARSFGPTMLMSDTKALSQFIKNAINGKKIILKSKGQQQFSYIYSIDAAAAILFCLLNGVNGESYNINNPLCDISLKTLALKVANIVNTDVVFSIPNELEASGYSTATKALLDPSKFEKLGYFYDTTLENSLKNTINILKAIN